MAARPRERLAPSSDGPTAIAVLLGAEAGGRAAEAFSADFLCGRRGNRRRHGGVSLRVT